MNNLRPLHRGVDVILSVGNKIVGGQTNAVLHRTMSPINITNKINGEWEKSLSGLKSWNLVCSGLIVKNEEAFESLETSFNAGTEVNIKLSDSNKSYSGTALITDFPVSAPYNSNFSYSITLLGVSELVVEKE